MGQLCDRPATAASAPSPRPSSWCSTETASATGNIRLTTIALNITIYRFSTFTNFQWRLAGKLDNITIFLFRAGIEPNPGPRLPHYHLTVAHINANSITAQNKLDEISQFALVNKISLLAVTETKLDNNTHPSLYELQGYHSPFMKNRNRQGGGVAIYARKELQIKRLAYLETDDEEWIWCKVRIKNLTFIICCVYLPPNTTSDRKQVFLENLTDSVTRAYADNPSTIILTGDFNAGNIYLGSSFPSLSGTTTFDVYLKQTTEALNLSQIITEPTRLSGEAGNLRDLIYISDQKYIVESGILSSFSTLDHLPVYVKFNIDLTFSQKQRNSVVWDYSGMDIDRFCQLLIHVNWDRIIDSDINTATRNFTDALLNAAHEAIPTKVIRKKPNDKPWVGPVILKNIKQRDKLFAKARKSNQKNDWDRWRSQRNLVTALNKRLKTEHLNARARQLLSNKKHPHKYHQILKSMIGQQRESEIPPLEGPDGEMVNQNQDKANILNQFFASLSHINTPTLPRADIHNNGEPRPSLTRIEITEREVLTELNKIDTHKSTGPDSLPAKVLKLAAVIIAEPLSKLVNKSLQLGSYPEIWKEATVKPIFKGKGPSSSVSNYRPISLLPCISKVVERLIHNHIYRYLCENRLLTDKQSGYRPGHSTQLQLVYLNDQIYSALDSRKEFTAIYLDISKYFNQIWHEGLLHKCRNEFGISGPILQWLKSYLSDRKQRVSIDNTLSESATINAGCPQGSVLGPLLALLYLNGLSSVTQSNILFFADDTSLSAEHDQSNIDSVQNRLQQDLNSIAEYGKKWAITFNAAKTIQQTFSYRKDPAVPLLYFNEQRIPVHTCHKHLGLNLSTDLRFHDHVNEMIKKATRALGPIYPVAPFLSRKTLIMIYKMYIRPFFDYGDIIYDEMITIADNMRLERLQNRILRLATGARFRSPTQQLLDEVGIESLQSRRKFHKLNMYYKINNPSPQIPEYITTLLPTTRGQTTGISLRNSANLSVPVNRTDMYTKSFLPDATKLWNSLRRETRESPTLKIFKTMLRNEKFPISVSPYYSIGSKLGNTYHTRLRLGVSALNQHLYQISLSPSPRCSCGSPTENTSHFLLDCTIHAGLRTILLRRIASRNGRPFNELTRHQKICMLLHGNNLDKKDMEPVALAVQDFAIRTGRLL